MANSKVSCSVARTIIGCNGDTLDSAPIEKQFGIRNEQRQDARRARRIIEPKQQRDCRRGGLSHVLPKSFPFRRPRWFVDGSACPGESQTNEAQPHASEWLLFKKTCFKQTRFPSARLCECTPSLTPPHGKLHCQTTRPNEKKKHVKNTEVDTLAQGADSYCNGQLVRGGASPGRPAKLKKHTFFGLQQKSSVERKSRLRVVLLTVKTTGTL